MNKKYTIIFSIMMCSGVAQGLTLAQSKAMGTSAAIAGESSEKNPSSSKVATPLLGAAPKDAPAPQDNFSDTSLTGARGRRNAISNTKKSPQLPAATTPGKPVGPMNFATERDNFSDNTLTEARERRGAISKKSPQLPAATTPGKPVGPMNFATERLRALNSALNAGNKEAVQKLAQCPIQIAPLGESRVQKEQRFFQALCCLGAKIAEKGEVAPGSMLLRQIQQLVAEDEALFENTYSKIEKIIDSERLLKIDRPFFNLSLQGAYNKKL